MRSILISCLFLFSLSASAECEYILRINSAVIEVLGNSQVVQHPLSIKREQNNSGVCNNYRIYFSKGVANSYQRKAFSLLGLNSISYNLHKNVNQQGTLKERNDALNSNEFLDGNMPDKGTYYTNNFFISVPGLNNTSIVSGYYYDVIQASAYSFSGGVQTFEQTENFTLIFYVTQNVQISIIDEGGAFNANSTSKVLDFGLLTQNSEKGADVRVLSNGSYQLKVSSQNNGVLKQSQNNTIAYALRVNGANVNLSSSSTSPVQIGSGSATSTAGDLYNLKVKINENTQNKNAGTYQDIITITAIAN